LASTVRAATGSHLLCLLQVLDRAYQSHADHLAPWPWRGYVSQRAPLCRWLRVTRHCLQPSSEERCGRCGRYDLMRDTVGLLACWRLAVDGHAFQRQPAGCVFGGHRCHANPSQLGQDACSPNPPGGFRTGAESGQSVTTQHQWIRVSNRHEARADAQLRCSWGVSPVAETPWSPAALFLATGRHAGVGRPPAGRSRPCGPLRRGPPGVEPVPDSPTIAVHAPLRATGGLLPPTALSMRGRRRPCIVCSTGGRRFRSMALRDRHRSVVDVATLPAAALTTGGSGERPDR
jgi:hypothetical protein